MGIAAEKLEPLTRKQAMAARKVLGGEYNYGHIQSRRSPVDGVAHVEAFSPSNKICTTVTIGPRGGIWSVDKNMVA